MTFDKKKLNPFPTVCGVYIMTDINGNVLYVGKALNLRNRIKQYFFGKDTRSTVLFLIEKVENIETIVVTNNKEDYRNTIVLLGLYDENNKLLNTIASSEILRYEESIAVNGTLKIVPNGSVIKCMVIDNLEDMNALSETIEINAKIQQADMWRELNEK